MSNYRRYWLDSDQICGINCSIKIEIEDKFMLTDMQNCYVEITLSEWEELKKFVKENKDLTNDFEESVCFTPYEKSGFITAILNNEFEEK